MKTISNIVLRTSVFFTGLFISVVSFAQDKSADIKVDVTTNKGNNWYAQPWVWIVGGAVFVLLLVALLRGGNRAKE